MSRKRRLEKPLRSPQRASRQWRNRQGRVLRRSMRGLLAELEGRIAARCQSPGCGRPAMPAQPWVTVLPDCSESPAGAR